MQLSPIALFVYNRLWHVQQTVKALQNNLLAGESELFVFSDAPQDTNSEVEVGKVREYIKTIKGFRKITIFERAHNLGLSQSIITGVNELIARYGRIIVLEDDLVTSPYFLQFMNDALLLYEDDKRIISICGYMYPLSQEYWETVFLRIADCWGWATWKRGWDLFIADGRELYAALKARRLFEKFNLDGAFNYTKMLKRQTQSKNDSWAVRWYASALLNDKLSLYPCKSLVLNIGFDCSGRHCGAINYFKTELATEQISVNRISVIEDPRIINEINLFFRKKRFNILNKILGFFIRLKHNINHNLLSYFRVFPKKKYEQYH